VPTLHARLPLNSRCKLIHGRTGCSAQAVAASYANWRDAGEACRCRRHSAPRAKPAHWHTQCRAMAFTQYDIRVQRARQLTAAHFAASLMDEHKR